eukprot:1233308-Rhodomonas_salina.4
MDGEKPKEFITLAKPELNWVYWSLPSEAENVPARKNHFEKLRVKFHKGRVHVNTKDFTFTDGLKEHVNSDWYRANTGVINAWEITTPAYGGARSCDGRENSARADLTGLPLRFSMQNFDNFKIGSAYGKWGEDMKTYTVTVGGWCSGFQWGGQCVLPEAGWDSSEFFCLVLDYEPTVLPRTCDDGNTDSGDGCSASCSAEAGFVCSATGAEGGDLCACACGPGKCDGTCITPGSKPTLKEAVAAAGEGETIYLSAGRFPAVHCGAVALVPSLTIQGQGSNLTAVDCNDFGSPSTARRPFLRAHAANLRVEGISILNAVSETDGAAIAILPSRFVLSEGIQRLNHPPDGVSYPRRRSGLDTYSMPVKYAEQLGWKDSTVNVSISISFFVNMQASNVFKDKSADALLFRYNGTSEDGTRYEITIKRAESATGADSALLCSLTEHVQGSYSPASAPAAEVRIDLATKQWHHVTVILQSPSPLHNSSDMEPSKMELYLGSVLASTSVAGPGNPPSDQGTHEGGTWEAGRQKGCGGGALGKAGA